MSYYSGSGGIPARLARNTAALTINQVAGVGFNAVLSVLVARQLGVEGLGKFAILIAYLQVFQVLTTMGVPRLVVREMARDPATVRKWFGPALVNQLLGASASAALLLLAAALLDHPGDTAQALRIGAISLYPFAFSSALETTFRATEQMELVAVAQILSKGARVVGSAVLVLGGHGIVALAWMIVLGQALAAAVQCGLAWRMAPWQGLHTKLHEVSGRARQSLHFLLIDLSVVLYSRSGVLILSQMVGEREAGLYSAAHLVVRVVHLVSASYSEAAFPSLSRLFIKARDDFEMLLRKSLLFGSTVALLVTILLVATAAPLIDLLYNGGEYGVSASVLRLLAPIVGVLTWNAILSKGLIASNRQGYSVIVSGAKLAAAAICLPLLTLWLGLPGAALATLMAGLTGTILNYVFLNRETCKLDLSALAAKPLAAGTVVVALVWVARRLAWPWLAAGGALSYLTLVILFRTFCAEDIRLFRQLALPHQR